MPVKIKRNNISGWAARQRLLIGLFLPIFFMFFSLSSCAKKKGFFGFGNDRLNLRTYRTIPVFQADNNLYWVYQLKTFFKPNLYGVKLERDELGWLNLQTISLKADTEFLVISHMYPPMKPGLYRITIYHDMEILDTSEFRLIE
jgi:hypothetical protein